MPKQIQMWSEREGRFVGHVFIGTLTFFVLCVASIGLSLLMQSVEANLEVPPLTFMVLNGLAELIVLVDAVLFAVYLVAAAVRVLWEILR